MKEHKMNLIPLNPECSSMNLCPCVKVTLGQTAPDKARRQILISSIIPISQSMSV